MFWEIMAFILGVMIWASIILWGFVFAMWTVQFLFSVVRSVRVRLK